MPNLYELAGAPIAFPPGGFGGLLHLSDGRFLRWQTHAATVRAGTSGDIVAADGTATGITFSLPSPGFEHDAAALANGGFAFVYHNDQTSPNGSHEVYLSVFNAAGTQVVAPFQVNTYNQGVQVSARIAVTAAGKIVVTWTDQSGIVDDGDSAVRARMFNPDGTTFGAEFPVNTTTFGVQHKPMIAALEGGGFVVSWLSEVKTGNFQIFDSNGAKVGPERAVTYVGTDSSHHPINDIQALSNGGFAVTYEGGVNNQLVGVLAVFDASGNQVALLTGFPTSISILGAFEGGFVTGASNGNAIFDNMGVQQGIVFQTGLGSVFPAEDGAFQIFAANGLVTIRPDDGTGGADVAPSPIALSETTPQNNLIATLSTSGAALNSSFTFEILSDSLGGAFSMIGNRLILADNASLDFETAASVSVTVAATDLNGNQYVDTFMLNVTDEAAEQKVTGSPVLPAFGTTLFQLAGGDYVAISLTFSGGQAHLTGLLFGPDLDSGQAFDILDVRLADFYTAPNFLALPTGGFVLTWAADGPDGSGYTVLARSFDANADPTSPVVQANTSTFIEQFDSEIATLDGGGLIIAWEDRGAESAGGLRYQLFDASLNRIGAELSLNSTVVGAQTDVSLERLQSGRVLATWGDSSGTGGDNAFSGIKGQLFDSSGQKIAGEFLVNSTTAGDQRHSSAIALASGQTLVTWQSAPAVLAPGTFMGQLFDANGAKVGGEITLESYTSSISNATELPYRTVALPSGGFALAWTHGSLAPDADSTSVWARIFDAAGAPVGGKFLVNVDPAGSQRISDMALLGDGNIYIAWTTEFAAERQARIFDPTGATTDWAVDDVLAGTAGADTLVGGDGNDIYIVNHPGDVVVELAGQGIDIIYSSVSYSLSDTYEVESLSTLSWEATDPLNLTGNGLANTLIGNAGANQLNGAGGADIMFGREGNDIYLVDNAGDQAVEAAGQGIDTIYTAVSYTLAANTDVEGLAALSFEGTGALSLTGNGIANTLIGNDGANQLDGAGGADVMVGRGGNDIYLVDNALDKAFEDAGRGYDVVYSAVSFALTNDQEIEGLSTMSWEATNAIDLSGNSADNYLIGNAGANVLDGKAGNDVLHGREGADTFQFTALLGPTNVDLILEYSAADDVIALDNNGVFTGLADGALPASAFVIGSAALDADDRIVYNQATGQLFFDADGNGAGAQIQFALLSGAPAITAADFIVI